MKPMPHLPVPITIGMVYPAISDVNFQNGLIPIPPYAEQKEIAFKVGQLMTLCDDLEKKIEKRDSYQEMIMQAVIKQTFA